MNKKKVMKEIARLASENLSRFFNLEKIQNMIDEVNETDYMIREKVSANKFEVWFSSISCELRESLKDSSVIITIRTNENTYRAKCLKNEKEAREFYETERKRIIMKRIVTVSCSSSFDLEKAEEVIENFNGLIYEELTSEGFKIWFKNEDDVEIYCVLREPRSYPGCTFYVVKLDDMGCHSGQCVYMKDEARKLYTMTIDRLLDT